MLARDQFVAFLLAGLHNATLEVVNYGEKIQELIQDKHENPLKS